MSDDNVKIAESFGWKYLPSSQDGELEPNYHSPEEKFVDSLPKNLCRYCGNPHEGSFIIPSCVDARIADLRSRLTAAEARVKELETKWLDAKHWTPKDDEDCVVVFKTDDSFSIRAPVYCDPMTDIWIDEFGNELEVIAYSRIPKWDRAELDKLKGTK